MVGSILQPHKSLLKAKLKQTQHTIVPSEPACKRRVLFSCSSEEDCAKGHATHREKLRKKRGALLRLFS
jgi:hypothetical protein